MEFIDTAPATDWISDKQEETEPNENDEPKEKKKNIIQNMGVIVLVMAVIFLLLVILFSMKQIVYYKYSWFKYYMQLKRKIFYNTFIRLAL
jgi:cytoskeletal protein RodZ